MLIPRVFGCELVEAVIPRKYGTRFRIAAPAAQAAHPGAAREWLEFIRSPEALHIFERYGFKRYQAQSGK